MSTIIDIRRMQPENAESPIVVTLLGMVTEVKEQPKKAKYPMFFTLSGMLTEVKFKQSRNAYSFMLFTLLGISIEVKFMQPEKEYPPMIVTLLGMVVFLQPDISVLDEVSIMALQLLRESYLGLFTSTFIVVRLEQSEKA